MKFMATYILVCVFFHALSQEVNIVRNGGFEDFTQIPTYHGQINRAIGWGNLNGCYPIDNECLYPYATPDFFHHAGFIPSAEYSYPLVIDAYEGGGFAYLSTYAIAWEFYEYINTELENPMNVGDKYAVAFMVARGYPTDSILCWSESNNLGVLFSTQKPFQQGSEHVHWLPQFNVSEIISHPDWQLYTFDFTADSSYRFMTIGNFYPRSLTDTIAVNICEITGINSYKSSGYFIDNISVIMADTISSILEAEVLQSVRQDSEQLIITLGNHSQNASVALHDMTGKLLMSYQSQASRHITMDVSQLPNGIYVLSIECPNGNTRRKIVIP
jgi:hypothetical protein